MCVISGVVNKEAVFCHSLTKYVLHFFIGVIFNVDFNICKTFKWSKKNYVLQRTILHEV